MIRALFTALGPENSGPLRRLLALLAVSSVLQGVTYALLVPLMEAILGPGPGSAWPWFGVVAVSGLSAAAATWTAQTAAFRTGSDLARVLHHRLGDKIVQLPLGWFDRTRVGELSRMNSQSVPQVMNVPAHLLRPAVTAVLTPLTVVAVMPLFDVRIALTLVVSLPLLAVILRWSNRMVERADRDRHASIDEAAGRVVEFAQAQPVLRAFGRAGGDGALDRALAGQGAADRAMLWRAVPGLVAFGFAVRAVFAAVLIVGVHAALGGSLAAPALPALLILTARFAEPLSAAAGLGASMRISANSLASINRVLAVEPLPEPARPVVPASADVEFRAVTFGYGDGPVLREVSFTMPERTMTALVGPSGAGKTTVARLLARFWDVSGGQVRIGGVDVRDIATEDLMALVSFVFQDVYLFEGSLADNIRVGRPGASDEEVLRAASAAGLDEVVAALPRGIDTPVGEAGTLLSGGQRQRVSIARALLKDAPIVVLDEATAALDPENDAVVQAAVASLAGRRTLLVIAHRLRTVQAADQILVLNEGRITERGRHEELLDAGGTYSRFWQERSRTRGWHLTGAAGQGGG
ncbi:ATP-binding cassette subfamily B protein [Thermocatellispora tengchongensis]|uniref:ATP-binding cassette subfamily B protein n=1 Tax=Thermocatellispora tengchongensis TaxID=1073253 RepID=A0A840PE85_9ACTN|nr:ABC transporter ATP-binding protein [Thermocatellispora tengchongensis]MBB5135457.1 ATP-binding cassette subfamily B protein [Thermocatellispora tengchongensis]